MIKRVSYIYTQKMLERLFDFPAKSDPGGLGAAGGETVQLRRVSTGHCRVPRP